MESWKLTDSFPAERTSGKEEDGMRPTGWTLYVNMLIKDARLYVVFSPLSLHSLRVACDEVSARR